MEGIQTIQALKAVQSSLPAQTTIPSDELVMLYAADGTPIAKIARDDLVKAVASVMASNSQTTFSKLLGVQANGTPMGIGASDLASVLGVNTKTSQIESGGYLDLGTKAGRCAIVYVEGAENENAAFIASVRNLIYNGEPVYPTSVLEIQKSNITVTTAWWARVTLTSQSGNALNVTYSFLNDYKF